MPRNQVPPDYVRLQLARLVLLQRRVPHVRQHSVGAEEHHPLLAAGPPAVRALLKTKTRRSEAEETNQGWSSSPKQRTSGFSQSA